MLQNPNNVFLVEPTPLPSNNIKREQKTIFINQNQIERNIQTFKRSKDDFDNSSLFSWSRIRQRYLFRKLLNSEKLLKMY